MVLDPRVFYGPRGGILPQSFSAPSEHRTGVLVSKRRLRARKALKILAGVLVTLGVGAIGGVLILTRTSLGQVFVMEQALRSESRGASTAKSRFPACVHQDSTERPLY